MISSSDIASTGVASTITMLVAYIDQTNSGSRNQVMPGRAQHMRGGDEIHAGGDRGKADHEHAGRRGDARWSWNSPTRTADRKSSRYRRRPAIST